MIQLYCRKKPLPLFSRKPVVKPKVKEEPDSGHGTYSQASDHGLNGSQAISQMSGPLGMYFLVFISVSCVRWVVGVLHQFSALVFSF